MNKSTSLIQLSLLIIIVQASILGGPISYAQLSHTNLCDPIVDITATDDNNKKVFDRVHTPSLHLTFSFDCGQFATVQCSLDGSPFDCTKGVQVDNTYLTNVFHTNVHTLIAKQIQPTSGSDTFFRWTYTGGNVPISPGFGFNPPPMCPPQYPNGYPGFSCIQSNPFIPLQPKPFIEGQPIPSANMTASPSANMTISN